MAANRYRLSPLAEADLDEIWLYTRDQWSIQQADQYVSDILDACALLASGRRHGRPLTVRDGYFKYPSGSHFLCFQIAEGGIDIIRILHQRMDVGRHL